MSKCEPPLKILYKIARSFNVPLDLLDDDLDIVMFELKYDYFHFAAFREKYVYFKKIIEKIILRKKYVLMILLNKEGIIQKRKKRMSIITNKQ